MTDYIYKKLGTLSEPEFKVNVFGIVTCIVKLHKPMLSGKLHSQIHIVDDTCREDFLLHIFCMEEEDLPKELQVYKIIRVHRMKVERYADKLDGRVFKGQDIVVFEPDENSDSFYTTAKVVTMSENDKRRVNQLRKWMKESYRFRSAFQVKDSELCNVTREKVFNLFCKLTNVRLFPDSHAIVLTITDATKCPELLYKVPDNWSGSELPEDFHRNNSDVDIIFYEGEEYYETIKIGDFCQLWNVKSVKCSVNIPNKIVGYKLVMLKDEGSIYTVPYGAGKTIVLQRTLEGHPSADFPTDSEAEISLQKKMRSFSISSEDSADENQQEDNFRNNVVVHQTNCNSKLTASSSRDSIPQTKSTILEVKSPAKSHEVSALNICIKRDSTHQLLEPALTIEENKVCKIEPPEVDLSGSDTDVDELLFVPTSFKTNTVTLSTEKFTSIQTDSSPLASHIATDQYKANVGVAVKRKLTDEVDSTANGGISQKNCKTVFSKLEMNYEDQVISHTSSKSEFIINSKTLKMWRNSFPTLNNVEQIDLINGRMTATEYICKEEGNSQSIDVFLIDVKPSPDDDSMDLVSGYCYSGCFEMFLYSTLIRDNRSETFLCPACNRQGQKKEVRLMLFIELVVMKTSGAYMNVILCDTQAEQFFGCSVEEFMCDSHVRSSIVEVLLIHTVYKNIRMGCKKVPILNLHVCHQENKYMVIDTKLKIK